MARASGGRGANNMRPLSWGETQREEIRFSKSKFRVHGIVARKLGVNFG